MYVNKITDFPFAEFGEDIKRRVRIIASPETSDEERMSIISVNIPSLGISEGHIHEDFDEYIYFDNSGKVVLDGTEQDVCKNSLIFAPRGMKHECRNESVTEDLNLLCIFAPPLKPYGKYPELIERTRTWLEEAEHE